MNQKIKTYIGFALKKGSVVFGLDNIRKKPSAICLVLVCETASEKTVKETEFFCCKNKIPLVLRAVSVAETVGRQGVKILALTDKSLAEAVLRNTDKDFKCVEVVN